MTRPFVLSPLHKTRYWLGMTMVSVTALPLSVGLDLLIGTGHRSFFHPLLSSHLHLSFNMASLTTTSTPVRSKRGGMFGGENDDLSAPRKSKRQRPSTLF